MKINNVIVAAFMSFLIWLLAGCSQQNDLGQDKQKIAISDPYAVVKSNKNFPVGTMGKVAIKIPSHFVRSSSVAFTENPKDYFSGDEVTFDKLRPKEIYRININVRQENFEPILSDDDFMDWWANHLIPYDKGSFRHRWVNIGISIQPSIEEMLIKLQGDNKVTCDAVDKFSLQHCVIDIKVDDFDDTANEYFYNPKTKSTLIACINNKSPTSRMCRHYFPVYGGNVISRLLYFSNEEISHWDTTEKNTKKTVRNFFYNAF